MLNSVFGLCCYTSDTGQSEAWSLVSVQTVGMAKGIQREPFAQAARSVAHVTQQKWGAQLLSLSPTLQPK
jgi:hypothetical protein